MISTGFGGLDALTGGLQEHKAYLLYGNIGTGKTIFGLQFLYQGLLQGENVVLVTRRTAQSVFDHGESFGLDLEAFARNNQLLIFEYVPKVVENAARLKDDAQIVREFDVSLGSDSFRRVVFDPVAPLLSSPSSPAAVFRARSLIQAFGERPVTSLYVFDTPEGDDYLASCKDFVFGVLRFEAGAFAANHGRIILERYPLPKGHPRQVEFEVTPGVGLTDATEPLAATAPPSASPFLGRRKVLILDPDVSRRDYMRSFLEKAYTVLEAAGAADGLAKVAAESPDLLIMEKNSQGFDGVEVCSKLRQNHMNLPIILLADHIRRARDRVEIMTAGADDCLDRPFDARVLKLKIHSLLRRYDSSRDRFSTVPLDASVTVPLERDKTTRTTNLTYFFERIRREITHSTENGLSFAVVILRTREGPVIHKELCSLAETLVREYDLVCVGESYVAVLLAETNGDGPQVFVNRLQQRWTHTSTPIVDYRCFDRHQNFLEVAKQFLDGESHPGQPVRGRGESERV
jgi:DNA-binding response OmpR family regulator/KaiC/GvpD/RAD55 family RecA-like ATPase